MKQQTQTRRQMVAALLIDHLGLDPETARAASLPIPGTVAETMIVEARCYEDHHQPPALPDALVYRLLDALQLAVDALVEEGHNCTAADGGRTCSADLCETCRTIDSGQSALADAASALAPPIGSLLPTNPFTVKALLNHMADERALQYARGR